MACTMRQVRKAPLPKPDSAPLSEVEDVNSPKDNPGKASKDDPTDIPASTSIVTTGVENLRGS